MALQDDAFQTEALLLQIEDGAEILIFGGSDEPQNVEPNAPVGSVYFRINGQIFTKKTAGVQFTNWQENEPGSTGVSGDIPFFNADGSQDNIQLFGGFLQFFNADGSQDDIGVV